MRSKNVGAVIWISATVLLSCGLQPAKGETQKFFLSQASKTLSQVPETGGTFYNEQFGSGARSWSNPAAISGDINGTEYEFHLYLASTGTTTFTAEILINGALSAQTQFVVSSTILSPFDATVVGVDPDLAGISSLELRLTHTTGSIGGILWGDFGPDDSLIGIPVPEPSTFVLLLLAFAGPIGGHRLLSRGKKRTRLHQTL